MSDISKCSGIINSNLKVFGDVIESASMQIECPLRRTCKRYLDSSEYFQSWIAPPYKNGQCDMYWEVK